MSGKPSISVVVPVYNSAPILPKLVSRLHPVLTSLANRYELVLVNDGSHDKSWEVIVRLVNEYEWIHGINFMRNYGQHNALLAGIREAQYEVIVTMDDDLQHPPEEIPQLVVKLDEGYDVVYGTPEQEQHGLGRDLASRVTKLALQTTMGVKIARNVGAFRAFRAQVRNAFSDYRGSFVSVDVLLSWGTNRFAAIPVHHDPRRVGGSNYTFGKLVTHALNMITGFSTWPLKLAGLIGFSFTLFGLGVLLYVLVRYLVQGGGVPGFTFLASVIAIFSGAQLFALGIIGEYLGRVHSRTIERPTYVVRDVLNSNRIDRHNEEPRQ